MAEAVKQKIKIGREIRAGDKNKVYRRKLDAKTKRSEERAGIFKTSFFYCDKGLIDKLGSGWWSLKDINVLQVRLSYLLIFLIKSNVQFFCATEFLKFKKINFQVKLFFVF